jgi:monoterpene epsilon-lactone hydrolase
MTSFRARAANVALRAAIKRKLGSGITIAGIRATAMKLGRFFARNPRAHAGVTVSAGPVPCEWFVPAPDADRGRTVLYLHGGGFVAHIPPGYRVFARRLAGALGAAVLLPDYRLAPEHPFPAGTDDCLEAYRWLLANGVGASRIVVAGDSAGGNLALVTATRIRDAGLPTPGCVVMLSAAMDLTGASASLRYNRDKDPLLVPAVLPLLLSQYSPHTRPDHPWISPLNADFSGLPPLLFHVGSTELIVDDSIRAAERARIAGVTAELEVWPDLPHVFQMFDWLPEAQIGLAAIARFVQKHVPDPGVAPVCLPAGVESPEESCPIEVADAVPSPAAPAA